MQEKFYVSHETQQMGPYSLDEIVDFVKSGTLSLLDYIYDESLSDWVLFMEHPVLSEKVKTLRPKAPPKMEAAVSDVVAEKNNRSKPSTALSKELFGKFDVEWFVLKGENKFGPFSYIDVVKMLQQGVVYEFDFAWHENMETWTRIAELTAFNQDQLKLLKNSVLPEISEVFFRRRYKRVKYGGTIIVHDSKSVWKGKAVEISEGGAGVIMENSMIVPGQELYLHFKPGDGVPPFNAICEVVSKEYVADLKDPKQPVRYGLKFKSVSSETENVLKNYTKSA